MEPMSPVVSPIASSHQHHPLLDYSYAYYQPEADHFHLAYSTEVLSQQQQQYHHQQQQQQQHLQQLQQLQRQQPQQQSPQISKSDPAKRHTYTTCYGTEENIYEEISEIR